MSNKDFNKIAKIEKAIKDKYGEEAIRNPKGSWDKEKEQKYLNNLKKFYHKKQRKKQTEQHEGFVVKDRKASNQVDRACPVCEEYSFSPQDDLYMVKFECCYKCYVQYIEGREERWKSGWRPNN